MDRAPGTREWDAATYDRVSRPQQEWAEAVIDRIGLRGDETVLDAGCGSGRVTAMLLDRLPGGHVIAVDGSKAMLAEAASLLDPGRVTLVHSDLVDLVLGDPVDVVFSNAVFHWVPDHDALFAAMSAALRAGGRLEAQCGGRGNVAHFLSAVGEVMATGRFAELAPGYDPHNFAAPAETSERLEASGFDCVGCELVPRRVHPPEPREFIRSVCLGAYLELLPEDRHDEFIDAVMDVLGPDPELDYVRLEISARKRAAPVSL